MACMVVNSSLDGQEAFQQWLDKRMTKHGRCERGLRLWVESRALLNYPGLGSGYSTIYSIGSS